MEVLVVGTGLLLTRVFFHSWLLEFQIGPLPAAHLAAKMLTGFVYAVMAGCITAALGRKPEAPTMLGALMLGMGIGTLLMNRGNQPLWYAIVVPIVGAITATFSGYAWLGRTERQ